jgi:hypothetical protein
MSVHIFEVNLIVENQLSFKGPTLLGVDTSMPPSILALIIAPLS